MHQDLRARTAVRSTESTFDSQPDCPSLGSHTDLFSDVWVRRRVRRCCGSNQPLCSQTALRRAKASSPCSVLTSTSPTTRLRPRRACPAPPAAASVRRVPRHWMQAPPMCRSRPLCGRAHSPTSMQAQSCLLQCRPRCSLECSSKSAQMHRNGDTPVEDRGASGGGPVPNGAGGHTASGGERLGQEEDACKLANTLYTYDL